MNSIPNIGQVADFEQSLIDQGNALGKSEWDNHSFSKFSYADSSVVSKNLFDQRVVPVEQKIGTMGFTAQGVINDFSSTFRMLAGTPVPSWIDSPYYPDAPNSTLLQLLGFTTATHGFLGLRTMYNAAAATQNSRKIGDGEGALLGGMSTVMGAFQSVLGFGFAGFRIGAIGEMVNPSNPIFGELKNVSGTIGTGAGVGLYSLLSLSNIRKAWKGYRFSSKLKLKSETERIDYIKKRVLGESDQALWDKAKKTVKGGNDELKKIALDHLRPLAEREIKLLKKHKFIDNIGWLTNKDTDLSIAKRIDHLLTAKRLTGVDSDQVLVEVGKQILVDQLKAKKIAKITRVIGQSGIDAIQKNAAGQIKDEEMGKVVLEQLDLTSAKNKKNALVFGVGAATMLGMSIVTGGIGAIVLAAIFTLVSAEELKLGCEQMESLKNAPGAPGRFDWVGPAFGIGLAAAAVGTSFVLASVFSMGLVPLILGVAIASAWIGMSIYHLHCINVRRERFIEELMKKPTINLAEFEYLIKYKPKDQHGDIFAKLGETDRAAINARRSENADYRASIKAHQEALEKQRLLHVLGRIEQRWLPMYVHRLVNNAGVRS